MAKRGQADQFFSFTFDPDLARMSISFENWAAEVKDWRPAWRDVVTLFRRHEKEHLNSQGNSTGDGFEKLSKRYGKWKNRHYPGLPILQRERVLFRALVEGGPGSIDKRTKDSLTIGIDPEATLSDPRNPKNTYKLGEAAVAHAQGKGLPQRPPIRFDGNVQNRQSFGYALAQIMQAHIVKARRKAFKKDIEDAIGGPAGAHTSPDKTIRSILSRDWK